MWWNKKREESSPFVNIKAEDVYDLIVAIQGLKRDLNNLYLATAEIRQPNYNLAALVKKALIEALEEKKSKKK